MEHKKFEYNIIVAPQGKRTWEEIETWLNAMGNDGWELITIDMGERFIFKRQIQSPVFP